MLGHLPAQHPANGIACDARPQGSQRHIAQRGGRQHRQIKGVVGHHQIPALAQRLLAGSLIVAQARQIGAVELSHRQEQAIAGLAHLPGGILGQRQRALVIAALAKHQRQQQPQPQVWVGTLGLLEPTQHASDGDARTIGLAARKLPIDLDRLEASQGR